MSRSKPALTHTQTSLPAQNTTIYGWFTVPLPQSRQEVEKMVFGWDMSLLFYIHNLRIQRVAQPDLGHHSLWQLSTNRFFAVSHTLSTMSCDDWVQHYILNMYGSRLLQHLHASRISFFFLTNTDRIHFKVSEDKRSYIPTTALTKHQTSP